MKDQFVQVQERIKMACDRVARDPSEVNMVCVSKKQNLNDIKRAYDLGIRDFGESYTQEWLSKKPHLPSDIRWHMVGHLQSRKITPACSTLVLVHSLSTQSQIKVWTKLQDQGIKLPKLLIQIAFDADVNRPGVAIDCLDAFLQACCHLPISGLMAFQSRAYQSNEDVRACFQKAKQAWDRLPAKHRKDLSMGVSSDFEMAIEEGATHVRLGTILMGARGPS